ncbi:hypothetical protein L7E55_01915 [Pelotomaculum isophthalicicum JI]|uniref:Uncharacterized protein n=1 Tax=Pelotomaculum isophthalicicum JI TaxID=947010 RepID=A0A9X4H4W7_9FIRM|nr:hypothetical protein [Pelotomaculum isophthalicicum]MDF9407124.1 hypothetical protein [Pelotomaculum isophthalicicum JI]
MVYIKKWIYYLVVAIALLTGTMCSTAMADPLDQWAWRNPLPQGNRLNSVSYGNGIFVAVGSNGTILTSTDSVNCNGTNWTIQTSGTLNGFFAVSYGNGTFAAVGSFGSIGH